MTTARVSHHQVTTQYDTRGAQKSDLAALRLPRQHGAAVAFVKDCLRDDWGEAKCAIQHYQTMATAWETNNFTCVSTRTEEDAELQRQGVHRKP